MARSRFGWSRSAESAAAPPAHGCSGRALSLTGKPRRFLRAEAHALTPLVSLGKEGVTDSVLGAVSEALLTHELIKIRVLENAPITRQQAAEELPPLVKAELVGLVGRMLILYKRHPHKPKLALPRETKGDAPN